MKTKALSVTLASLMSIQSVGFAQPVNRVDGIGTQAIANAKSNLQTLNHEILLLDQSLSKAADEIEKRDSRGGITNGLAIAGAGLGLGLSAMAFYSVKVVGGEGSGIGGMLLAVFSVGSTVASLVQGATSQGLKTKVDSKQLETQLTEAQKGVEAAMSQTTDKQTTVALTQLGLYIKNTQAALSAYTTQESEVSRNRLASQATQLVGAALLMYGITQQSADRFGFIGVTLMSAGNLAAIVSGFQGSEAKQVLKEINQTREALKAASATLQ